MIIHSTVLALDGRRMSKSLGTGIDPMEPIERARRRRDPLRAAEDLVDAGRPLLVRRDRGRAEARDQALERRAADAPERRGRRARAARRATSRSAGSSRASMRPAPRSRSAGARFEFAASTRALYHLTFDDFCDWYAEAIKPRLYDGDEDARRRPRSPRSSGCSRCCTRDAARDRGDLVAAPGPRGAADRLAVARAGRRFAATLHALDRVQEAAQIFRRSGVQVELGSGDERRIFAAVVRPERTQANGDARGGARAAAEGDRARRGHARERALRRRTRRPMSSRRSARSSSATAASSPRSAARSERPV